MTVDSLRYRFAPISASEHEGCKFIVAAVTRHDAVSHDVAMVMRTLAFMVVRQVLGLVGLSPSADAKDVEIAVLRHQLLVLIHEYRHAA